MDVRLSMYLEWLSPDESRNDFTANAQRDPAFSDVRVCHEDLGGFREGTLYVSMSRKVPDGAGEGIYFICTEETKNPSCNCVVIETDWSEMAVYDKLRNCTRYYGDWVRQMELALINGTTFQELLDISEDVLKNPAVILDSHYNFLAGSRKISKDDAKLYEVKVNGQPSPDTLVLLAVEGNGSDEKTGTLSCGAAYRVAHRFGENEMLADFKNDGFINLCLVIRFSAAEFSDAMLGIIDIFSDHLNVLVKRDDELMSSSGGIDFFAEQLINGANPDQIARSLMLPRMGEYVTIMLEPKVDDFKSSKIAVVNIMNGILPQSRAFCHDGRFYSIVTYSSDSRSQTYYVMQQQRISTLCGIVKCRCGISNMFMDLADLRHACVQANEALVLIDEAGRVLPPDHVDAAEDGGLCFYKNVMLFHMIERTLGEAKRYCFYPENFARMLRDDMLHGTNNCDILEEFLLNGQKYTAAAEKLHMHRNNVLYRLNKMHEKYNIDYENREDSLMLTICCLAAKMFPPTFPGE